MQWNIFSLLKKNYFLAFTLNYLNFWVLLVGFLFNFYSFVFENIFAAAATTNTIF